MVRLGLLLRRHLTRSLLVFLLVPSMLAADRVVLKSGAEIEGKIVYEDGAEVHIERAGILSVITKDLIKSVERLEDTEVGPGEVHATEARAALQEGDAAAAWRHLLAMRAAEAEAVVRNTVLVRRVWDQNLADIGSLKRQNLPAAMESVNLLAQKDSVQMLRETGAVQDLLEKARRAAAEVRYLTGREQRREGKLVEARDSLRSAVSTLTPADQEYSVVQFELARALRDIGTTESRSMKFTEADNALRQALDAYNEARANATRDAAMVRQIAVEMAQVREALEAIARATAPTPTPIPTPTPVFVMPTPTPTPTPEPGIVGRIFGAETEQKLTGALAKIFPKGINPEQGLNIAFYVLLFIIFYWMVPHFIFWLLTRRADFVAAEWKKKVKYLGPFSFIGYIIAFFKHPQFARKRQVVTKPCPHCGFNLDHILQYETLDFHHCPHCGGEIEPLFTIDDYIKQIGASLATDAEKLQMGMVTMASFVEKDQMQRLVRALTTKSVRMRASDIHIEPQDDHVAVRHRIDGMMIETARFAPSLGPAVVSAVKVKANMDIAEKRRPQDGSMQIEVDGAPIDVRVASSPSQAGETVSLRLLDFRSIQVDPKRLGMSKSSRELFEKAIREPHGLVVVCGPTGSGKTTTLYVALQIISTGEKNIISIEDPIEFRLPRINQIQVNPAAGLTFATGLRSILRQDPDVLMIGEVRDRETAEISVNAAQTGHLVFTSLHTIDSCSAVTRLYDLGVAPRQFADSLSLVIAQRLIRLVCPNCAKPEKPKDAVIRELNLISSDLDRYEFVMGAGCETCNKTGYLGRTGLFEMLVPNSAIRTALEKGGLSTAEVRELAIANGMRTLREEALILLRNKMTTGEEVIRVTK